MGEGPGSHRDLPTFRLPKVTGGFEDLAVVAARSKLVTVVFWSATCSHCRRYDPYLNEFRDRHPEVPLLVVAARQGETEESLRRTMEERVLRFPMVHDEDLSVAQRWDVRQTPRAFLMGSDLRWLYRGAIDNFTYREDPAHEAYLEEALAAALGGRSVPRSETPGFGCPVASAYYKVRSPFDRAKEGA